MNKKIKKIICILSFQLTICYIMPIKKIRKLFLFIVAFLDFLIFVTWQKYKKYISKIGINSLLQNENRNYDKLILGRKYIDENATINNCLDLRNYGRNFYTDILIMKRYYSFLKTDGVVEFIVYNDNSLLFGEYISIFDASLLHKVTVYKHNKYLYKYVYDYKEIFSGILFLLKGFNNFPKMKSDKLDWNLFMNKIDYVRNFAKVRNLSLCFRFKGFSHELISLISEKYPKIKIKVIN